jgi:hypothetical protein
LRVDRVDILRQDVIHALFVVFKRGNGGDNVEEISSVKPKSG